ncbi:hypothetical protein [Leptolinea tardivitalis]|uniref:Uncharacterized protein n=1 Tax=Leptolinea tardivitalis TaxID=229920 RepID=A0A0P6X025_9CHLR|nr:hypothetical protein [Leptolinea tardivitalis]KPL72492.1 hypothetical protein ADM99_04990 [Leptolinea tardivitalis]GAP21224.1 hypothetical protein LTAR_01434 [Leptolinea tardivitalis]
MNKLLLGEFSEALKLLFSFIGTNYHNIDENEADFTYQVLTTNPQKILEDITKSSKFLNIFHVSILGYIQQYSFMFQIINEKEIMCQRVEINGSITPQSVDDSENKIIERFKKEHLRQEQVSNLGSFIERLEQLSCTEVDSTIYIKVSLNKKKLIDEFDFSAHSNICMYIFTNKLVETIKRLHYWELNDEWGNVHIYNKIFLLADANGFANSNWLQLYGKDLWSTIGDENFIIKEDEKIEITNALEFRKNEVFWGINNSYTPHLFFISENKIDKQELIIEINRICCEACICHVANRASFDKGDFLVEFGMQYKKKILSDLKERYTFDSSPLMKIFTWAYENSKADKLDIAREVIFYYLRNEPQDNFLLLLTKSDEIYSSIKCNFQFYLTNNVGLYFAKREELIQFLDNYFDDTNDSISRMTTDFVNDFYKSIGIVLADVIAILINPQYLSKIIIMTAVLFFIYICISLIYSHSFIYQKFYNSRLKIKNVLSDFSSIISEQELVGSKKEQYSQQSLIFYIYFLLSIFFYEATGFLAYFLFSFYPK